MGEVITRQQVECKADVIGKWLGHALHDILLPFLVTTNHRKRLPDGILIGKVFLSHFMAQHQRIRIAQQGRVAIL